MKVASRKNVVPQKKVVLPKKVVPPKKPLQTAPDDTLLVRNNVEKAMLTRTRSQINRRVKFIPYALNVKPYPGIAPKKILGKPVIWQYWNSGIQNAPDIVKSCLKSVEKYVPKNYELIRLDDTTLKDYIDIPLELQNKKVSPAHFADVVRLILLHQYGGIWMDATIYLTGQISKTILEAQFFVFKYPEKIWAMMSNWFIVAKPENTLIALLLSAILNYWKNNAIAQDYFLFHYLFECVLLGNTSALKEYQKCPWVSSQIAHTLQYDLKKPFTPNRWAEISKKTSIHKLTWKCQAISGTTLTKILTNAL